MVDLVDLTIYMPILAVGLDLLIGDPRWLPHPVRLIGNLADGIENIARESAGNRPTRVSGFLAASALVSIVATAVFGLTSMGTAGFFVTLYLCASGLALRCLLSEANQVHGLVEHGQITEARVALSMLVSRDTGDMSENEIRRSLAETLSENLNDGFTAPLFWLCVGGPVAMWGYKTISTLDSMWGYKTERYEDFGWFAAKADDVLAWIPARLTALAMFGAATVMRLPMQGIFKRCLKDADKMESPNAGWPMAAGAWLAGAQMGGCTSYHGTMKYKPLLGTRGVTWTKDRYLCLRQLSLWSGVLFAILGQVAVLAFHYLRN